MHQCASSLALDPFSVSMIIPKVVCTLNEISITESEVYDKLSTVNPNKAPGFDCLHPQLLKNCASSLKCPIFYYIPSL